MKNAPLALVLATMLLGSLWAQASKHSKSSIEGAWELVSGEIGGQAETFQEGTKQRKLICSNHFVWVIFDTKGKPSYTGGGTYILRGNSYSEHIQFMNVNAAEKYIGKDQPFTVRVDGDTLTQTGSLSDGQKLSETWKRVQ